ncbi:MAG: BamA/TamA family outer membrane protein [Bacteroidota bacterium]
MRINSGTVGTWAKISLFCIGFLLTSCNTLKRVEDDELLLVKNSIYADSVKVNDEDIESLLLQRPNSTLLGYPLRLNLYNLAKKNPDSSYQAWLYAKPKRKKRLDNLLSEKQVYRLGESFLVKGLSVWLKKIGEPPAIIDTATTTKSLERLSAYYDSKGYFNNTTGFSIDGSEKKQRAAINYEISLGDPYIVDSVSYVVSSKAIDSLFQLNKEGTFVQKGKQFDLVDFNAERGRLSNIFRNSGIYNFQESSISYNIIRDTSALAEDRNMDVELSIANLKKRSENTLTTDEYKVHRFDKINIYTDYLFDSKDGERKFLEYEDYTIFYHNKLRFKPKTLTNAIFFKKDSIYRDLDRTFTYRQLTNLNVFKYPSITFEEDSTQTKLNANVYLAAKPKYSLSTEFNVTHSNIQQVGLSFSPALQARNLFKGAENLSLSGRVNIGSSRDPTIVDNRFFNILEFGADLNLDLPRIWLPGIKTEKIIPSYMLPKTRMSLGASFQENIGLDKQTFNSILSYNWSPNDFKKNIVEIMNIQFVENVNTDRFFNVYRNSYDRLNEVAQADEFVNNPDLADFYEIPEGSTVPRLQIPEGTTRFTDTILSRSIPATTEQFREVSRIEERRQRLTENNLIFASNYTFQTNNRNGLTDNNFFQFRWTLESAGNVLSAFSNIVPFNENDDGDLLVFGVPFSQYIKTDFEYIKYWDLSRSNVLALRTFAGMAIPYGNSTNIPFVRSYFAGGANDNRAWFPYSLGPGRTDAINDFNEANFKLALNLEYRFPVVGNFKGALFADLGNIWNVFDDVDDPDATFNGFESLVDIAIGSGFGLRYDFTYFLFRVDLGFKTYNPAEEPSKRWFRDYNFANSVLQIGINYPF